MQSCKIGFNNFKAFGPDMQYFSKKPIMLVYGPNSIGKSSLLRALLFREYLKTARYNFQEFGVESAVESSESFFKVISAKMKSKALNIKTNQFGDIYDIGHFESVVHKRDISQKINYDMTYINKDFILGYISYFNYLTVFLHEAYYVVDNEYFNDLLEILKMDIELTYLHQQSRDSDKQTKIDEQIKTLEKTYFDVLSIKNENLTNDSNVELLKQFIDFTSLQLGIKSVRIKTSVNNDLLQEHQFYVDDELLFTCKEIEVNVLRVFDVELYTNNAIFKKVFFKPDEITLEDKYIFNNLKMVPIVEHSGYSLFDIPINYLQYIEKNLRFIIQRTFFLNNDFENIYIGPIRAIPSRYSLIGIANKIKKQRRKQRLIRKEWSLCIRKTNFLGFLAKNKYTNAIWQIVWWPTFIFCAVKKKLSTLNNSLIIRKGSWPLFIKPDSKNKLHLWYSLASSNKLKKRVNEWLKEKGKHNSSYSIVENSSTLNFYDESTQTNVHPQDMGVGISQSLPIIIASNFYKNTNIFIEQPELHLHPKLQAEMADEFIKSYKDNSNQFMIETHSEHLLLRIMKRMRYANEDREDRDKTLDLTTDDVCVLYIDSHKGKTFIRELKLDEDGTLLSKWPNGFFEESYNEMFS